MTIVGRLAFTMGLAALLPAVSGAEVMRLEITRREVVLNGQPFGAAGPYERLVGTVHFALDPTRPANGGIVDLALAPRNARGLVEFSADFYLLKPVDPAKGNGRLFYEAGNRGTKRILPVFQRAAGSADPATAAEFGNGALMRQGYTLVWMGWQWDVPDGRMRMEIPIATDHGRPIVGLVRGNFIPGANATSALIADRGHKPYPVVDPDSPDHVMYVRTLPADPPQVIPRARWRFTAQPAGAEAKAGPNTVTLEGGFEAGRIYDVVYRAREPRVIGTGLAGTRDFISFLKYGAGGSAVRDAGTEVPALRTNVRLAIGWGVSQTGRFLRHFVYEGFNADEAGRIVFDGVFDQVGGAGRGSFNHRFGQQSRDQLQHFNIHYPVDMFPFSDDEQVDRVTGARDGLLVRARRSNTVPKFFHLLTNSEYFNRAGSLTHTDVTGTHDVDPPATSRIYQVASAPHIVGPFPPAPFTDPDFVGQADMNPLDYTPVIRALFKALDAWVAEGIEPPASKYPRLDQETLTAPNRAGWPQVPGVKLPLAPMTTYRLDFGPEWKAGRVSVEPPALGEPFVSRVPAVDDAGNDRGGIRLPLIAAPLATHTGWNYRRPSIGAPDRLASEIGSYLPLPKTRADRERTGDSRRSIEERYADRDAYRARAAAVARELVAQGFVLAEDEDDLVQKAVEHYEWAIKDTVAGAQSAPSTMAALQALQTRAERTGFTETSRYDDVLAFLKVVDDASPLVKVSAFGYTFEGRSLPLAVVGKVADATPAAVRGSGKLRVYIQANIHAGEVEGKEAVLALVRDIARGGHAAWLDSMVLLVNPIYNADGNEKVTLTSRGFQHGPIGGQGTRANAQGLNINRDDIKLETPEARSMVRLLNDFDPHVMIDLHTTNGSRHAYHLTYETPNNPAVDPSIVEEGRAWMAQVTESIRKRDGWEFHVYGNVSGQAPDRVWRTVEDLPRYTHNYWGLRNRFGILSETYSYLTFADRVTTDRRFLEEVLGYAHANAAQLQATAAAADAVALVGQRVSLRSRPSRAAQKTSILMGAIVEELNPYSGRVIHKRSDVKTPEPMWEEVDFEATETERVPGAYYVPASETLALERLRAHGIVIEAVERAAMLPLEEFRIASTETTAQPFENHQERTVTGHYVAVEREVPAGAFRVPMTQRLARLAFYLLEPRSNDGLLTWNVLDEAVKRSVYPILRTRD